MTQRRCPSFFKILLDPAFPHLPLPPDYVRTHLKNKPPKDAVIRSATGGHVWRLKIKKIGEILCFSNGWDSVVKDVQLGFGDFLVFRFDGKSSFKLVVYSPNGCEKDFPEKIKILDDDVKEEVEDDVDVKEEDEDEDDGVKEVEEDEFEDEVEDDDDDDDDEEDEVSYEEVKDDEEEDGEDDGDGEGDGGIDGEAGDPFFMMVISKVHKTMMRLPADFAELAGIVEGTLTVANVDGKEWQIGVRSEKQGQSERFYLSSGWSNFMRNNDICEGDECVFKFLTNEDKLLLARVIKSKRPVRNSGEVAAAEGEERAAREEDGGGVDVKSEDEGVEVVERSRNGDGDIDGDDGDPFFMVVISKTHKTHMRLPAAFTDLTRIVEGTLTMTNLDGEEWQMGVRLERPDRLGRYCLSAGWQSFRRSNDLCEGDECVFKFIRSEQKLLLARVIKRKRPTNGGVKRKRVQPVRNSGEVPATKGEKRKRGQVAREEHGGGVDVKSKEGVEVVKRSRGRPPKKKRTRVL